MALIVEYHVIADMYPVGATSINAGMLVTLTADLVVPATSGAATAIGIAGDSRLTSEGQTTAYSDQVRIGAAGGATRYTENRVSDFYNEALASQKMTVYNGGGKFWVSSDLIDSSSGISAITLLEVSNGTSGNWMTVSGGTAANEHVGTAVGASQAYPSGVPGTDTTDGSITLGNYVPIILRL